MRRHAIPSSLGVLLGLAVLVVGGCGGHEVTWRETAIDRMSPTLLVQKRFALEARDRAARALRDRLQEALDAGGAVKALETCRLEAPGLTTETKGDVLLGRTSFALRNPANAVPSWAASYVRARRPDPVWLKGSDGSLAGLLPIQTVETCLACHGPEASLAEDVKARLRTAYPEDRATGFKRGDLRGWYWVVVRAHAAEGP